MPNFVYERDIPFEDNDPSEDQPNMKINTNSTDDLIAIDHYSFNDNLGGLHKQVQLPLRGGSPGSIPPGLIANEGALYTKTVTSAAALTETGVFYSPDTSGLEYQLTRTITASNATFSTNTNYSGSNTGGWTFLPGGLLLQYGIRTVAPGSGGSAIIFPVAFTTTPFGLTTGINQSGSNIASASYNSLSTTGAVLCHDESGGRQIFWMAIGK